MTASYVFGTVTVTNGSNIVTGDGTGWETALVSPGFLGTDTADSVPVPVLRVDSDTQLTLAQPWRGATQSGVAYWLSYDTRDGQQTVNNHQLLSDYIARLNNPILAGLAALTPQANSFPAFDSGSVAEWQVLTELARLVLSLDVNAAGRQNKLLYFNDSGAAALTALSALSRAFLQDGFTPVQQGGGAGQTDAKVRIGYTGSQLKVQVNAADQGYLWLSAMQAFSPTNPGYIRLPNGFIFQWGTETAANANMAINFPMVFPNALFFVIPTMLGAPVGGLYSATIGTRGVGGFTLHRRFQEGAVTGNSTEPALWFAGGY